MNLKIGALMLATVALALAARAGGPPCLNDCSGNGDCVSGDCECYPGWVGVDCSIWAGPGCPDNCSGHGTCLGTVCTCNVGWVGVDCSIWVGGPCQGDTGGNGEVNIDDLLAVIAAWGPCRGCPEDVDSNGVVDIDDLLAVIGNWGSCP